MALVMRSSASLGSSLQTMAGVVQHEADGVDGLDHAVVEVHADAFALAHDRDLPGGRDRAVHLRWRLRPGRRTSPAAPDLPAVNSR